MGSSSSGGRRSLLLALTFALFIAPTSGLWSLTVGELQDELGLRPMASQTMAPDFTVTVLAGGEQTLSSLRGQVVFLNFWATWCPPCRLEMPSMERLHERLGNKGLTILAIDLQEPEQTVAEYVADNKLTFSVGLDSNGRVAQMYGIRSIPTTYIIGKDGEVIAGAVGAREWDSEASVQYFSLLLGEQP